MRKRELKNMEWGILITAIILCIIGIVALFSATQETEYDEFTKQIIWLVVSLIAMVIVMFIDYNLLLKASPVLYGIFIILLIGVLFTSPINGATSWFNIGAFSLQPGEFAKVFVILFLTYTILKIQHKGQDEINRIIKAEKSNNALFTKAINDLENNKPLSDKYYLCENCGYVEADSAPDKCPICDQSKNTFKEYK